MDNINFDQLLKRIEECCLTEDSCGTCQKDQCLVGYCKHCAKECLKSKDEFIDDGFDEIPLTDTKVYDEETTVNTIGFILNQCRNCRLYHDEDCIVNILRSSLEVILFGEPLEYKGSTLVYLDETKSINLEFAQQIFKSFQNHKRGGIK
ncbi:hypothetical protein [Thermohalobacter berrensis]|uniref:Uncharacterized protein n=1 Tax=Thermohalobacter berrensis TaxID=99594 RepID=A0A419SWI2_9FIRM|nr:hypothetical protein [Thermohalobacter berrensis]RKD29569.1 hypothetical protein BET03_05785 [Thermohalobacter berrensis]